MDCKHEFEEFTIGKPTTWGLQSLRFVDLCIFCGESRYETNLKQQLAAANARVAELETQKPSYKAEFDCVYKKLKAEESLSAHYKQRAEQAEAQCDAMQTAINRYVIGNIELLDAMKAALEEKP